MARERGGDEGEGMDNHNTNAIQFLCAEWRMSRSMFDYISL